VGVRSVEGKAGDMQKFAEAFERAKAAAWPNRPVMF
jgi:hypothetical protein